MKEFRSLEEVERASLRSPLRSELRLGKPSTTHRAVHGTLKRLIDAYEACGGEYVPEDDNHVVLLEPGDTDETVRAAIGYALRDAPLEGCVFEDGFFLTCVLWNNQYGISIVTPDPVREYRRARVHPGLRNADAQSLIVSRRALRRAQSGMQWESSR